MHRDKERVTALLHRLAGALQPILSFFTNLTRTSIGFSYTAEEDFVNADAVFDCIGDTPEERFDLTFCGSLLEKQYVS